MCVRARSVSVGVCVSACVLAEKNGLEGVHTKMMFSFNDSAQLGLRAWQSMCRMPTTTFCDVLLSTADKPLTHPQSLKLLKRLRQLLLLLLSLSDTVRVRRVEEGWGYLEWVGEGREGD